MQARGLSGRASNRYSKGLGTAKGCEGRSTLGHFGTVLRNQVNPCRARVIPWYSIQSIG